MTMIEKVRADLAYRLPDSGAPLGHIVLPRAEAECLVAEFETLANAVFALILSDEEVAKARAAFRKKKEATCPNSTPRSGTSGSPTE